MAGTSCSAYGVSHLAGFIGPAADGGLTNPPKNKVVDISDDD
jgi:hypothetical protein